LEVLRNLTEHIKLFEPLFPALGDFFVCPKLKTDAGDVDEFFDTAILLEGLKEATALLILAAYVI